MFKRKIYKELLQWKEKASKEKALLIEGARRVGKSTVVEEFAKKEYESYLLVDFNDAPSNVTYAFENYMNDLPSFFSVLSAEYKKELYPGKSLMIFDEIQRFPKARQSIKKLVKDGRYSYIETGSLISIKENVKDISIPSEERSLKMYPMDFEEFSIALGEEKLIDYIKECYQKQIPLLEGLHRKAMLLFKQYMLVGGMPKVVDKYLENNRSFKVVDDEKRDILELYRNDIEKADVNYSTKIKAIFDQIPSFLSMHEKRVRLRSIDPNGLYPAYEETFYWLSDSMMTNECFLCHDPNVGLSLNEDRTSLKCYLGDTGLLFSLTFTRKELSDGEFYRQIMRDNLSINKGMFFENVIAQILTSLGYDDLFFYTSYNKETKHNDIEIDFIISNGSKTKLKIYPIEVKSTTVFKTTSLMRFKEKFKERIGKSYIISPKPFKIEGDITYLPCYMTICL